MLQSGQIAGESRWRLCGERPLLVMSAISCACTYSTTTEKAHWHTTTTPKVYRRPIMLSHLEQQPLKATRVLIGSTRLEGHARRTVRELGAGLAPGAGSVETRRRLLAAPSSFPIVAAVNVCEGGHDRLHHCVGRVDAPERLAPHAGRGWRAMFHINGHPSVACVDCGVRRE